MDTAKKEKLAAVIFGVCALFFLFFGIQNMEKTLDPWKPQKKTNEEVFDEARKTFENNDTDGDGLIDSLEISLYETSIYLADTDSDGIDDGTEVERGSNPLCPFAQNCLRGTLGITVEEPDLELDLGTGVIVPLGKKPQSEGIPAATPDEIRKALINGGANPKEVEQIDDETLLKIYEESAKQEDIPQEQKVVNAFVSGDISQFRSLLLEQGVPKDVLDAMTDEELQQVLQQAIQDQPQ